MISLAFILIMGIGGGGMFRPQAADFAELFGSRLRYSGFRLCPRTRLDPRRRSAADRSALLVAWMAGAPWGVACYVILLSLITAVSVWWGPETHECDLADEHQGVSVHAN